MRDNPEDNELIKPEDTDIEIISRTGPDVCGGTDATHDKRAPKTILSEDMTCFAASTSLRGAVSLEDMLNPVKDPLGYVSAFAVRGKRGSFLYLNKAFGYSSFEEHRSGWAYVQADVFPALTKLTKDADFAKRNGYHSETHGLPENFGGRVEVTYGSGERISFSDNRTPVFSQRTAKEIERVFEEAMKSEPVVLPDENDLSEVRFHEERHESGFYHAVLSFLPDKTGMNRKQSRFEDPKVYESEKPVDEETVSMLKRVIKSSGILAWADLPKRDFTLGPEKTLEFYFRDGTVVTVPGDRNVPGEVDRAFFTFELEMVTKH